jgi:hypothetical protein
MHYTDYGSSFRAYETLKSARDLFVLLPAMDKLHSVEQQQRASEGARPAKVPRRRSEQSLRRRRRRIEGNGRAVATVEATDA